MCGQRSALGRQQAGHRRVSLPRAQGGRWAALQPHGGHTAAQGPCLEDKGTSEATWPPVPQAGPPTEHTQERHKGTSKWQARSCWGWGWGPGQQGGVRAQEHSAPPVTQRPAPASSRDTCEDSAFLRSWCAEFLGRRPPLPSWGRGEASPGRLDGRTPAPARAPETKLLSSWATYRPTVEKGP